MSLHSTRDDVKLGKGTIKQKNIKPSEGKIMTVYGLQNAYLSKSLIKIGLKTELYT
jgi:CMP-N-acetylneuraminic acid synthetase